LRELAGEGCIITVLLGTNDAENCWMIPWALEAIGREGVPQRKGILPDVESSLGTVFSGLR
jgi:hypothetical protein